MINLDKKILDIEVYGKAKRYQSVNS